MANRQADIEALLARARADLSKIQGKYTASLEAKAILSDLKIDIKNFCENLRSVLDYLAREIREKHCPAAPIKDRFYFPILPDRAQFTAQMAKWFPSLDMTQPGLWDYLESIQPYRGPANEWLGLFSRVNNENKHEALVEQTRIETEEIRVTTEGGGRVSWNPENVRFGGGVYIGGVPVDPATQRPVPHPSQKVEHIKWIDFRFRGIEVSAIGLLKQSLDGVGTIANKVRDWL